MSDGRLCSIVLSAPADRVTVGQPAEIVQAQLPGVGSVLPAGSEGAPPFVRSTAAKAVADAADGLDDVCAELLA